MTGKLVFENMKHKPMRSLLSALLIGVPVTLILCLVGLSHGLLNDASRRAQGSGADLFLRPSAASFGASMSSAPVPEKLAPRMEQVPHVAMAVGMLSYVVRAPLLTANGVDLAAFDKMSGGFEWLSGGPFQNPDEVVVDDYYARENHLQVGSNLKIANHDWRVTGIFRSGKLSHIIVPLKRIQELTSSTGMISQIFIRVDAPENIKLVKQEIEQLLPNYQVMDLQELQSMYTIDKIPALRPFINMMIGVGVFVGLAVVCLSMYMAVLQRTREIGILKSLGASRGFILGIIEVEAMLMAFAGTVIGILLNMAISRLMMRIVPAAAPMEIVPSWWPIALGITLAGAVLGALYPGMNAVRQDPIEALAYE